MAGKILYKNKNSFGSKRNSLNHLSETKTISKKVIDSTYKLAIASQMSTLRRNNYKKIPLIDNFQAQSLQV